MVEDGLTRGEPKSKEGLRFFPKLLFVLLLGALPLAGVAILEKKVLLDRARRESLEKDFAYDRLVRDGKQIQGTVRAFRLSKNPYDLQPPAGMTLTDEYWSTIEESAVVTVEYVNALGASVEIEEVWGPSSIRGGNYRAGSPIAVYILERNPGVSAASINSPGVKKALKRLAQSHRE